MISEETKREVKVDNSAFRDRFRFLFSVNDNIVCERFFKINYFNIMSIYSDELRSTIGNIVRMIQDDMKSKSRIHTFYTTPDRVKLTGFEKDGKGYQSESAVYLYYPETAPDEKYQDDATQLKPYDVTFKFEFQMAQKIETNDEGKPMFSDYKSLYTAIWDGTQYPKDIRNSVDLSNSMHPYRDCDVTAMNFIRTLNYRMAVGKKDLIYETIRMICDATSGDGKTYTKTALYGTGNVVEAGEPKGLRRHGDATYTYVTPIGYEHCDVYHSTDGKLWAKRSDGRYGELIEYSYDPYGDYERSWYQATRKKTEAYKRRNGFRQNN